MRSPSPALCRRPPTAISGHAQLAPASLHRGAACLAHARTPRAGCLNSVSQHMDFTILCAPRTGEVIGAKWPEIDRRAKVWTIPKERMKAGKEHRVPLGPPDLEILDIVLKVRMDRPDLTVPASAHPSAIGPASVRRSRARSPRPRWRISLVTPWSAPIAGATRWRSAASSCWPGRSSSAVPRSTTWCRSTRDSVRCFRRPLWFRCPVTCGAPLRRRL